jgi:thiosulfate dehydrogenase
MVRFVVSRQPSLLLACALLVGACERTPSASAAREAAADPPAPATPAAPPASTAPVVLLHAPADSEIPPGPLGASIRRGHALLTATRDSLPSYVGNRLRCMSCHLDDGRRANAAPLVGAYVRYPAYMPRSGRVATIEDRINGCFLRSMNGRPLPADGRDLRDIVAYLAFLSRGVPVGATLEGQGFARLAPLTPDTARGEAIFINTCARCHGAGGQGTVVAPPVWGARSFNIGAGMARLRTAASFIRHNMPFDRPGSLTDQQAFDVAAYVTSRPRPDFPGKENDWPNGDAPPDAAYPTRAAAAKKTAGPNAARAAGTRVP